MKKTIVTLALMSIILPTFTYAAVPASETEVNGYTPPNRSALRATTTTPISQTTSINQTESISGVYQEDINSGIVDEQARLKAQLEELQKQVLMLMEILKLMSQLSLTQ